MSEALPAGVTLLLAVAPLALLVFFMAWEAGAERQPFASAGARWRHAAANLSLLAIAMALRMGAVPTTSDSVERWAIDAVALGWTTPVLGSFLPPWGIVVVQLGIALVAVDLFEYGRHRLHHAVPVLWRVHRVHHSDPLLDATSAGRTHPLESIVTTLLTLAVLLLAGVPLWIEALRASLVNPVVFAQHANVRFGPALERLSLFATPEFHRVHHSREVTDQQSNFGQLLTIWDRWFGTHRPPPSTGVASMGVDGLDGSQSLARLLWLPVERDN